MCFQPVVERTARSGDILYINSPHFLPFSFQRVAPIAALLHGAGRKVFISAQSCKLQPQQGKERPWDKVRRWQPWVVLPVSLSSADGACRASGPAQSRIASG